MVSVFETGTLLLVVVLFVCFDEALWVVVNLVLFCVGRDVECAVTCCVVQ